TSCIPESLVVWEETGLFEQPRDITSTHRRGLPGWVFLGEHPPLLQPERLPVCARRDAGVSLEQLTEECRILITDSVTDLLHGTMIAFEQALSGSNPQLLQVHQWAVSGRLLKAANEVAKTHT